MALNIDDEDTFELVKELAELKGISEAAAVRLAVDDSLRFQRRGLVKEKWIKVGETNAALFGGAFSSQDIDELLFDEIGLPK